MTRLGGFGSLTGCGLLGSKRRPGGFDIVAKARWFSSATKQERFSSTTWHCRFASATQHCSSSLAAWHILLCSLVLPGYVRNAALWLSFQSEKVCVNLQNVPLQVDICRFLSAVLISNRGQDRNALVSLETSAPHKVLSGSPLHEFLFPLLDCLGGCSAIGLMGSMPKTLTRFLYEEL
jgi:hypothetical protein